MVNRFLLSIAIAFNVDVESDWYVVEAGDVFTGATIESGQFEPIFTLDNGRPPVNVLEASQADLYLRINDFHHLFPVESLRSPPAIGCNLFEVTVTLTDRHF